MHAHRCAVRRTRTDDRRPNARGAIARAFRPPLTRAAVPAKEWAAATRKRCFRCAALLCCASDAALFVSQIDADAAVINAGAEPCTPFRVCHSRCVGSRTCIAYCSLCYLWRPCPDALNASRVLANILAANEPEIAHAGLLTNAQGLGPTFLHTAAVGPNRPYQRTASVAAEQPPRAAGQLAGSSRTKLCHVEAYGSAPG